MRAEVSGARGQGVLQCELKRKEITQERQGSEHLTCPDWDSEESRNLSQALAVAFVKAFRQGRDGGALGSLVYNLINGTQCPHICYLWKFAVQADEFILCLGVIHSY